MTKVDASKWCFLLSTPLGSMDTRVWLFSKKGRKETEGPQFLQWDHTVACPLPNCDSHTLTCVHTHTHTDHTCTQHSICNSVFLPKISFKQEHFYPMALL